MIEIYVYPYKCLICRRTGKYSTGIESANFIDFRCPHDGSALIFQESIKQLSTVMDEHVEEEVSPEELVLLQLMFPVHL